MTSASEINNARSEYDTAGMHGCIGSADATHVSVLKMQCGLKQYKSIILMRNCIFLELKNLDFIKN